MARSYLPKIDSRKILLLFAHVLKFQLNNYCCFVFFSSAFDESTCLVAKYRLFPFVNRSSPVKKAGT